MNINKVIRRVNKLGLTEDQTYMVLSRVLKRLQGELSIARYNSASNEDMIEVFGLIQNLDDIVLDALEDLSLIHNEIRLDS